VRKKYNSEAAAWGLAEVELQNDNPSILVYFRTSDLNLGRELACQNREQEPVGAATGTPLGGRPVDLSVWKSSELRSEHKQCSDQNGGLE